MLEAGNRGKSLDLLASVVEASRVGCGEGRKEASRCGEATEEGALRQPEDPEGEEP